MCEAKKGSREPNGVRIFAVGVDDDGYYSGADLFLATLRRVPTANAEGLARVGGQHRKGLGEARL